MGEHRESFWSFLSKRRNQQTLSWIGGGIVVIAGGIWAVITFVWPHQPSSAPRVTQSTSGPDSPAIANVHGNVTTNSGRAAP
jgi:hypothetical protein